MTRYREVGLLAEGGMALVAQAERDDGATVVIKRVRPPFCFDPSFLRLFADEGAVHGALDHDNIVRLLDRGEDEAGPYLVFEHVDGTDLAVVLEQTSGGLDVECVLAVALPLFRALAAAHDAKDPEGKPLHVVHRDVSPGNVLIASDGEVKLADFGVASFALKSEATVAGEMKGKFAYMAPEQTRGEKVGPRADLFAAGVVLWECLAGKRLFDGPTDADVVAAVRNQPAPRLDDVRPGLPPALTALVAELLEKEPEKRPAGAGDVVKRLDDVALALGLDEGLRRHAARLARQCPRREVQLRDVDARRRTQRVLGAPADGAVVVREQGISLIRIAALAAAAVGLVAVVVVLARAADREQVTALPPSPPPKVEAPAPLVVKPAEVPPPPVDKGVEREAPKPVVKAAKAERPAPKVVDKPAGKVVEKEPEPKAVEGFGQLSISADPWASVTVDGNLVAKETPVRGLSLPAGHHVVVLSNPAFGTKTLEVDVPANGEVRRFVDLTR
jgi:serine/threonine-protein kinase